MKQRPYIIDPYILDQFRTEFGVTWNKLGPVVVNTKNAALVCDPSGATPVKIQGSGRVVE